MATSRFDGRGFNNPLNPLSLHSENHYRDEPSIGSSFMSDERRVFGVLGGAAKAGAKSGTKTGAKIGAKASAKAAAKSAAKAASKAGKSALKSAKGAIKATWKSPTTRLFGTVGIITIGGYYTFTEITGTQLFETDCESQAAELHEKGSPEYQAYLEQCYDENAESMGELASDIGKYAIFAGAGLVALILLMRRKNE